jgi:hypothetical protein
LHRISIAQQASQNSWANDDAATNSVILELSMIRTPSPVYGMHRVEFTSQALWVDTVKDVILVHRERFSCR